MKIRQITETTAGATASGSVASVAKPLGKMQERSNVAGLQPAEKIMKGKAKKKGPYANSTLAEGKIKDIAIDLEYMDPGNFKKKYGKTKEEMRAALKEEKIAEADLIVMPGMRRMKDTSFIPHKADRRDHEVEMARSDLYAAAKDAMRIFKLLKDRSEDEGLMGWQQSYITLAADYLNSVADSIEYNAKVKGSLDEMTGGVLAGGMSNFEESTQKVDSLVTDALKIMKSPEMQDAVKALKTVLGHREYNSRRDFYKFYIKQLVDMYGKKEMAEAKCPSCGGEMVSEELMNEKKDACYYKVKSRYKVWPSAYASGALVKCRKKGSKNWGKSKK